MVSCVALAAALHASVLAATRSRGPIDQRHEDAVAVAVTVTIAEPPARPGRTSIDSARSAPSSASSRAHHEPPRPSLPAAPDSGSLGPITKSTKDRAAPVALTVRSSPPSPEIDPAIVDTPQENATDDGTGAVAGGAPGPGAERGSAGDRGGPGGTGGPGGAGRAAGGGAGSGEEDLERRIRSRIVQHRRYPALARRRGIEGTVRLSLAVRADGSVDVFVVRGADPMLDEAAREAVLAAAPLPVVRQRMEIDLEYRLVEP